ncbi:hypothetical protein HNY73_005521 [Argiope bruennichi]|uniref:Uncharacterized protein n=1 Tax=Argiope bruennichi TaxID=94029 RepID=A0A8T0FHQ4_ARGBR|nr:hypothetical protein HNY73_005521 [Argiope bruennichi]
MLWVSQNFPIEFLQFRSKENNCSQKLPVNRREWTLRVSSVWTHEEVSGDPILILTSTSNGAFDSGSTSSRRRFIRPGFSTDSAVG